VIKAVLMNSATKPVGWNNGQTNVNGVITTTQSVDYAYGAGILNLNTAWSQYTAGTTDVAPISDGGEASVQPNGWVFGNITHIAGSTATEDYLINSPLSALTPFNVTLDWFSDDKNNVTNQNPTFGSFDNLDLQVWLTNGSTPTTLIAQSISPYNSMQELDFNLPSNGTYLIQVTESNYLWNFDKATTTDYGLAWSVPEPASAAILLVGGSGALLRRRNRS